MTFICKIITLKYGKIGAGVCCNSGERGCSGGTIIKEEKETEKRKGKKRKYVGEKKRVKEQNKVKIPIF